MSLWSSAESVIVRNDLRQVWQQRGLKIYLVIIPFVLVVLLPVMFIVGVSLIPNNETTSLPEHIKALLPETSAMNYRQAMFLTFTKLLAPMFFLIVPIVCATTAASSAFIRERDEGTLETIMLTNMDRKSLYHAKLTGSFAFALLISLISFLAFSMSALVGDIILGLPLFFSLEWAVILLLLTPACSFLCSLTVSARGAISVSFIESMQTMGYHILFLAIVYILQFIGLFKIDFLALLIISLLLLILDMVLYNVICRDFTPEKLLTRNYLLRRKERDLEKT